MREGWNCAVKPWIQQLVTCFQCCNGSGEGGGDRVRMECAA